ncbi:MAG: peptidylprolyl isomerase [Anaerolineae bacterium]
MVSLQRFVATLILIIVLAACSAPQDTSITNPNNASASNPPVDAASDPANEGLVARVNDVGITQEAYQYAYNRRRTNSNAADDNALAQQVLNELIEQELIEQAAPDVGVTITDADVEAEIVTQREIAGSEEQWLASLEQNDYTADEWFEAQREVLITLGVRNVLIEPYLGEIEQVNARHILVRTEERANEVLDRLEAGEGFATLAAEYSLDVTTAEIGGNLGWFARNELYYPSLENRAFDLEIGSVSYVSTPLGYHVVQTLAREVREVELERLPILSENIFNSWLDTQYRNANIEVYLQ